MNRLPLLCALLGLSSITSLARAESSDTAWDGGYNQVARRRSGFVAGLTLGLAAGSGSGYPNELAKLGDPLYERNTGAAFGGVNRLWFGGALTDYLVFGMGIAGIGMKHDQTSVAGSAFIFHVEAYPLFYRGGVFRDLSIFGDFGAGGMKISGNNRQEADGGLMSVLGFGAGYEPVRFWKFTFGPAVEYWHWFSQTMTMDSVAVEARLTFVGGP
ncbi:MAG TPA: hypothetical protein VJV79_22295 [Polyangiaceae bacterium]|nr:hypothetical protein [Polyangiaceae bacterium]